MTAARSFLAGAAVAFCAVYFYRVDEPRTAAMALITVGLLLAMFLVPKRPPGPLCQCSLCRAERSRL